MFLCLKSINWNFFKTKLAKNENAWEIAWDCYIKTKLSSLMNSNRSLQLLTSEK